MNFLERLINNTKRFERRYHRTRKSMLNVVAKGLTIEIDPEEDKRPRISNKDLAALHKKVANNDPDKQLFLDSLYDKYFVSKLTHRISIRDGIIVKKKG